MWLMSPGWPVESKPWNLISILMLSKVMSKKKPHASELEGLDGRVRNLILKIEHETK